MADVRDVGVDFLYICNRVGKKDTTELHYNVRKNALDNVAYEYNGFIEFYNGSTRYVTRANNFSRRYLSEHGFEIDKSGNIPVTHIDHITITQSLYEKLENFRGTGYSSEQICNVLIRDRELRTSLALNGEELLMDYNHELDYAGIKGVVSILQRDSKYYNPTKYVQTFVEQVKPDVDNWLKNEYSSQFDGRKK